MDFTINPALKLLALLSEPIVIGTLTSMKPMSSQL